MNEPDEEDINQAKAMLLHLRGTPWICDFCGRTKTVKELHPEEGGDWICDECIIRLGYGADPKPGGPEAPVS